jgi:hypothetical protein
MLSSTTGLACPRTTRRKWHGPRSMFVNYLTIPNRLARLGLGYAWDCLDHVVVFGERHLRDLLNSYQKYYNEARTHLSLHKDAPIPVPSRLSVAPWQCQFWVDCTTSISERKFPTGTGRVRLPQNIGGSVLLSRTAIPSP